MKTYLNQPFRTNSRSKAGLFCVMLCLLIFSCKKNAKTETALRDLDAYVKVHTDSVDRYLDQSWDELQAEYDLKRAKLERKQEKLDEELKTAYAANQAAWEAFRHAYLDRSHAREVENVMRFRKRFLPAEIQPDLSNLTPASIAAVYQHFVRTVKRHKDVYSKDDWARLDQLNHAIEDKKAGFDDRLKRADRRFIMETRTAYHNIRAVNRPVLPS